MLIFNSFSSWWIIPCIALGLGCAWILYAGSKRFSIGTRRALFSLRALAVALLAFLLLAPLIKTVARKVEKPIILIAQDLSSSLLLSKEANYYKTSLPAALQSLEKELSEAYEVKTLSFGDAVKEGLSTDYTEKRTDFGQLFDELNSRYTNRNVGAVILLSDGLYNRGINPLYSKLNFNSVIYTVAMGDTTIKRDVLVASVEANKIAYLGNRFRMTVNVSAKGFNSQKTRLNVSKGGKTLFEKEIPLTSNDFRMAVPIDLEADKAGTQQYRIRLEALPGELTDKNNDQTVFVDILDARQKVLIVAAAPHPDLGAIKQSLESNKNYETNIVMADKASTVNLRDFSLVILHQIPSSQNKGDALTAQIKAQGIPCWYILGNQTYVDLFNRSQTAISLSGFKNSYNDVQPVFRGDFYLFTLSDAAKKELNAYPPLSTPFATVEAKQTASVLLTQQIGSLKTQMPLFSFSENGGIKSAFLFGEGLWRWRLANFLSTGNHEAFNELITKSVQYLTAKDDKRKFRVTQSKQVFDENEPISFGAELYNDSYEPVNEPEVAMEIKNEEGKTYKYTFSKSDKAYFLNAGVLPVGNYRFTASTKLGTKAETFSGAFIIQALNVEEQQSTADHGLLYQLAHDKGGKMIYPPQLASLVDLIKQNEAVKTLVYEDKTLDELINIRWLLGLITLLLAIEWFVRKQSGGV